MSHQIQSYRPAPVLALALALAWSSAIPAPATAQLISLKTVPVASGDQFMIFPSARLAMGGIALAVDDPIADPFTNPAMGVFVEESQVYSSPTFYSISNRSGSARTLPAGAAFTGRGWFGSVYAAFQDLKRGEQFFGGFLDLPGPNALSRRTATNKYANVSVGREIRPGLALGASAFVSDLNAVDGVEHLFATASDLVQRGHMESFRLGLSSVSEGDRRFEAVLLHHRYNVTHDVSYVDFVVIDTVMFTTETRVRVESNPDRSHTWGLHLAYHQPIGTTGWRVGGILTGNRKGHPKIPNYELMNIPRDPGNSNAFNIGFGLAKETDRTTFGIDLVYEPASSDTWAEADTAVTTASGIVIPAGGRTIENAFDFSNGYINMGVSHAFDPVSFQLGMRVRSYGFHLDQWDNVAETFRRQDESWTEWVPSWGAQIRLADFELRYMGRITTGTGRPGVGGGAPFFREGDFALDAGNDILLAPTGALTLQDATVLTNQISVVIPIR